jgi:hypothetical protein
MAIFNDGHAIDAAVARATRAASESHAPRPCPNCGHIPPPNEPTPGIPPRP